MTRKSNRNNWTNSMTFKLVSLDPYTQAHVETAEGEEIESFALDAGYAETVEEWQDMVQQTLARDKTWAIVEWIDDATAKVREIFDETTPVHSPQSIRGGFGAWDGTLGEALHHHMHQMIDWDQKFIERYNLPVGEDEDGTPTIDGDPGWWAGDHLELWTFEDVADLVDDPNVTCGRHWR